jgi:hypothetical protein
MNNVQVKKHCSIRFWLPCWPGLKYVPAELDTLAGLHERVLRHLDEEPIPGQSAADEPALPR